VASWTTNSIGNIDYCGVPSCQIQQSEHNGEFKIAVVRDEVFENIESRVQIIKFELINYGATEEMTVRDRKSRTKRE
jgi:hypothetical protein